MSGFGGTPRDFSADVTATSNNTVALALIPADKGRQYLLIQNLDATDDLYVNFDAAATVGKGSIRLGPYGALEFSASGTGYIPTGAVTMIANGTSNPVTAKTS